MVYPEHLDIDLLLCCYDIISYYSIQHYHASTGQGKVYLIEGYDTVGIWHKFEWEPVSLGDGQIQTSHFAQLCNLKNINGPF